MRSKVNPAVTSDVSGRFIELIEIHLRMSWADAAHALGYTNRTTLDAIRKSRTLPGLDKICALAKLRTKDGRRPNIDWLFSSEGIPLVTYNPSAESKVPPPLIAMRELEKLPPEHYKAVAEIIRLLGERNDAGK